MISKASNGLILSEADLKDLYDIFRPTLVLAAIAGFAFIFLAVAAFLFRQGGPNTGQTVNYVDVVTILLTTVTVIFAIAAAALTLIGVWGFRNIKKDAGRYAAEAADAEITKTIQSALEPHGAFTEALGQEILSGEGPFGQWLRKEIQRQVQEQIGPLRASVTIDETDASDEGEQD